MNKTFKILEIIWLVMACIGAVMCAYAIATHDRQGSVYFLVFTLVCGIMYAVRKRQRIKFEINQKHQEEKK